jgi:hypothetical protein
LNGAPTAAGRAVLQSFAGDRPQVQVLLRSVPAGIPNGTFTTFTIPGQPRSVELGDFTGSSLFVFDDQQGSSRSFLKNAQTWSRERLKSSKEWSLMDAEHPLGLSY